MIFLADSRVMRYSLDDRHVAVVTKLPAGASPGLVADAQTMTYVRLSRDGQTAYALVAEPTRTTHYSAWRIDMLTGAAAKLWSGLLDPSVVNRVTVIPPELDADAAETLFGSREYPVSAPRFSVGHRYYFFVGYRSGFFVRTWVGGYDRVDAREFTIKTLRWGFHLE